MTKIEIGSNETELSMECRGHAGYASVGNDIVCAAISVLTQTLIAHALNSSYDIDFGCREGHLWIYTNDPRTIDAAAPIITGLCLIEGSYPTYVEVTKGCPIIRNNPVI